MNEKELLHMIETSRRVTLIEPKYKRKYPPLGLMKIAKYCKNRDIEVDFYRHATTVDSDVIMVATMFTYDFGICENTIQELRLWNPDTPIVVGGIAASVNPKKFIDITDNVSVFTGYSEILDTCPPDYEMDFQVDEKWSDWSYCFTTRGCPNTCAYCFVPKIECGGGIIKGWENHIRPDVKLMMLFDNNITAFGADHVNSIADFAISRKHRVRLDNAVDCKFCDDDMAKALSRIPLERRGLRSAFDRIDEDGMFQDAMKRLMKHGISKYNIMAYVLFGFDDTPKEADYRARECQKLGITPYPAWFQPINAYNRKEKYVSKKWTKKLSQAFNNFWMMGGFYTKYEFEDFAKGQGAERYKLTAEDWAKWDAS